MAQHKSKWLDVMMENGITDNDLAISYAETKNIWDVARKFDLSGQFVHRRLKALGTKFQGRVYTDEDAVFLVENYDSFASVGKLNDLADIMGVLKTNLCRRARALGLTNQCRANTWSPRKVEKPKPPKKEYIHPRGMLGKKHTDEMKRKLSAFHTELSSSRSPEYWKEKSLKTLKTRMEKSGTTAPACANKRTWKSGWRIIGGRNIFFRSRWEANYARYLEVLKQDGKILEWEHEPKLFLFENIENARSYLPDFSVTTLIGEVHYHEVKGWMDERSIEKLKLMSEFYPEEIVILIDAKWFKENEPILRYQISDWEQKNDYEVRSKPSSGGKAKDDQAG